MSDVSVDSLYEQLLGSLARAKQISELNNIVIERAQESILSLGSITNRFGGDAGQNQIKALARIKDSPQVKEVLPVVYGQQTVLFVSSCEGYLKDIVRHIGNHHVGLLNWPDKSSGKIDLAELSRDSVTIGDLVLAIVEQRGNNFQDLQSTKRFFSEYLGITVIVDEVHEQNIILATAMRHVIVHSAGIVNGRFLSQIRNLDEKTKSLFSDGKLLAVDEEMVRDQHDSFLMFAERIRDAINKKINKREKE